MRKDKEVYSSSESIWPIPFSRYELRELKEKAENKNEIIILSCMMYLGLDIKEIKKQKLCDITGRAIESNRSYLHIPLELKNIIYQFIDFKSDINSMFNPIIDISENDMIETIEKLFQKAGFFIKYDNIYMKMRRTSAMLHFYNNWTEENYIQLFFHEIMFIPEEKRELFYKKMTMKEIIEKMPSMV